MTRLIVAFRNFANAHKNGKICETRHYSREIKHLYQHISLGLISAAPFSNVRTDAIFLPQTIQIFGMNHMEDIIFWDDIVFIDSFYHRIKNVGNNYQSTQHHIPGD